MDNVHNISQITIDIATQADENTIILDVREEHELDIIALDTSKVSIMHIPLGQLPFRLDDIPHDKKIYCLCKIGARSQRAAEFLLENGFSSLHNIIGGIEQWAIEKPELLIKLTS